MLAFAGGVRCGSRRLAWDERDAGLREVDRLRPRLPAIPEDGARAHARFEPIHPFLDGNGRVGRLLITLLLCSERVLSRPLLYLSVYLKRNRDAYYARLTRVRTEGVWAD